MTPQFSKSAMHIDDAMIVTSAKFSYLTDGHKVVLMMRALERHQPGTSFSRTLDAVMSEVNL